MSNTAAHALLSPSSAHRWLVCTPSARLEASLPERVSVYADEGSLAHRVCELSARRAFGQTDGDTYDDEMRDLRRQRLWKQEMLATAAIYVQHLTDRAGGLDHAGVQFEVCVDISRYAPESFGTCDCIITGGGEMIVTDYKHGRGVSVPAYQNPQMMLYALGALSARGDSNIERISMYIDQPRIGVYDRYCLTADELIDWGERVVRPAAKLAYAGDGTRSKGNWCRFCRAKGMCG